MVTFFIDLDKQYHVKFVRLEIIILRHNEYYIQ